MSSMIIAPGRFGAGGGGAPSTSYANPGGTGNRSSFWTITTNITPASGAVANLVNGNLTGDATNAFKMASASDRLKWIRFHATDGLAYCIDALKLFSDVVNDHDDWFIGATNNGEDFVELGTLSQLAGAVAGTEYTFTNTGRYTDYIIWQKPGSLLSTVPWLEEIDFKISTSGAQTSVATNVPSYLNKYGFLDRTSVLTVTSTSGNGGGTPSNLVDGGAVDDANDSWWFQGGQSAREIIFDAGSGNTFRPVEATWWQDNTTSHGTWQAYWGDNVLAYTSFGSTFTLGGVAIETIDLSAFPAGGKRALRFLQTVGSTSSSPFLRECLFKASKT